MLKWLKRSILAINIVCVTLLLIGLVGSFLSPNTSTFFALVGLSLPILFLIQLVFLLIWILLKHWLLILPLFSLLIGAPILFSAIQFNPSGHADTKRGSELHILSYNTRLFGLYNNNRHSIRKGIISFVEQAAPDIVCFQEFYHRDKKGFFDTKDTLLKTLNTIHFHESYTHHMKGQQHFGLATFSKYPIINKGKLDFGSDPNNSCIFSDIVINKDTLRVYNAHLASIRFQRDDYLAFGDKDAKELYPKNNGGQQIFKRLSNAFIKRAEQMKELIAHFSNSPHPIFLCGDFNDTPASYAYQLINSILVDAYKKSGSGFSGTYIGSLPSFRIDYLMHSESIHSWNYERHDIKLSDHYPISCFVQI